MGRKKHKKHKHHGHGLRNGQPYAVSLFTIAKNFNLHPAGVVRVLRENARNDEINYISGFWTIPNDGRVRQNEFVGSNDEACELFGSILSWFIQEYDGKVWICSDCRLIVNIDEEIETEIMTNGTQLFCEYCGNLMLDAADEFVLWDEEEEHAGSFALDG